MKDPILESFLKNFSETFGYEDCDEPEQFENFMNYYVVSKHYTDQFDPEDVAVGVAKVKISASTVSPFSSTSTWYKTVALSTI